MSTEIVRVATSDGLFLEGALQLPSGGVATPFPFEAVLLVHGTGGNFYTHGVLETFALRMAEQGVAVLRINTRGHDGISSIPGTGRSVRGGAAFEVISDCRLDLAAWIGFLVERGFSKIALAGHSMGGVKSAYALAHERLPAVVRLFVISSPRFCHAKFLAHPKGDAFRRDYAQAQAYVAQGEPERLMSVTQPLPFIATAAGFVEKYGPDDRYDLVRLLPQVLCPTLVVIGTRSPVDSIAFDGLPEAIRELEERDPKIHLEMVEGANTNYTGCAEAPFLRAVEWLRTQRE